MKDCIISIYKYLLLSFYTRKTFVNEQFALQPTETAIIILNRSVCKYTQLCILYFQNRTRIYSQNWNILIVSFFDVYIDSNVHSQKLKKKLIKNVVASIHILYYMYSYIHTVQICRLCQGMINFSDQLSQFVGHIILEWSSFYCFI